MSARPDEHALMQMRERGGTWAAYENKALDSHHAGHLQFLKVGEGCSFAAPPEKFPADTFAGAGWRYLFIGMVNLDSGEIERRG